MKTKRTAAFTAPLFLVATLSVLLSTNEAHAGRWFAADLGRGLNSTGGNCFSEYYGSETNGCSSWQYWLMPLVVDSTGWLYPTIQVEASSASNTVTCYAYSADIPNSGTVYQTQTLTTSTVGVAEYLYLSNGTYVPNYDWYTQVVCEVNPNSVVYGVNY